MLTPNLMRLAAVHDETGRLTIEDENGTPVALSAEQSHADSLRFLFGLFAAAPRMASILHLAQHVLLERAKDILDNPDLEPAACARVQFVNEQIDSVLKSTSYRVTRTEPVRRNAEPDEAAYPRQGEMQEIANGAYGDGPAIRGAARDHTEPREFPFIIADPAPVWAFGNSPEPLSGAGNGQPMPVPATEPELMLVLSSAHVTKHTAWNFANQTDDAPEIFYEKMFLGQPDGWLIPIGPHHLWSHMITADLVAIRKLAEARGCRWIMLDPDADIVPDLPTY